MYVIELIWGYIASDSRYSKQTMKRGEIRWVYMHSINNFVPNSTDECIIVSNCYYNKFLHEMHLYLN